MRPRILHVSASFPRSGNDNVAPFLADLVRGQCAAGWSVAVIAAHDDGLPTRHTVAGASVRRVRYGPSRWEVLVYRGGGHGRLRSPLHVALLPVLLLGLFAAAWRECARWRPDVVHAHWLLPGGLVAALLPRNPGRRVVLTVHGTDIELAGGRVRPLARWIAHRVDVVVAVSDPLARRAEDVLALPSGSVGTARLPIPDQALATPIPDGHPRRALAAGRASVEKGFDVLVAAMTRPETSEWTVTLVTDGPERPALERQAHAAGLDGRVRFEPLQRREDLFALVRSHHAVVVPSRTEGLGMVAVEALALGRPVVASATGGLLEVVHEGEDGSLVPPDDPQALADALARLPLVAPKASAVQRHRARAVIAAHAAAYGLPDPERAERPAPAAP